MTIRNHVSLIVAVEDLDEGEHLITLIEIEQQAHKIILLNFHKESIKSRRC